MLTTHNKILEVPIAQQANFSSKPSDRLHSKPEPSPYEHCNYVIFREGVEESIDTPIEKGREIIMIESKERNDGGKAATFIAVSYTHLTLPTKRIV